MPKVLKGKRKRAYRPKTRTGCLTCRIRRVKCDETRPVCLRCTSGWHVCDGYATVTPVVGGPSFDIHGSPQSKRSFAFFVQRTSTQLAGFFGSDFWERHVLQAAYHESAVCHAIVAIGSLHELSEQQVVITDTNKSFALEQYNLAIRDLLVPLSQNGKRGIDVCLIACVLFTCIENMQGHHASAISHIESGAKLLQETMYDERNRVLQHQVLGSKSHVDSYAPLKILSGMFARVDSKPMLVGDYRLKLYENYTKITLDNSPLSFSNIVEAKDMFEYGRCLFISNRAAQQSSDNVPLPASVETQAGQFPNLLWKFSLALQAFVKLRSPNFTPKDEIAMAVLQLHVQGTYLSMHLEQQPPENQRHWEEFLPHMEEMLARSEKIISSISSDNNQRGLRTSFCSDMGYIIPLYTLFTQCHSLTIRRRVIALLRSAARQEGLWNSLLVAKAAERIMEIEESMLGEVGACTRESNRASVQPFLELDGRGGRLKYMRQGLEGDEQIKVVEEMFTWESTYPGYP